MVARPHILPSEARNRTEEPHAPRTRRPKPELEARPCDR